LSFFSPFFFGKVRLSSKNHLAVTEKMVSSGGEAAAGEHRSSFYLAAPSLEFRAPSLSLFPGSFLSRAREGQKREAARLGEQQRHEERASGEESPWFSANDETPNPLSLSLFRPNRRRRSSNCCKDRDSAAPSPIRARRAAGLGEGRRGGVLAVSFESFFFRFFFSAAAAAATTATTFRHFSLES
jgi:hypothetical protein